MPRCQCLISRQSRLLPHIRLHHEHYPLISCWNSDDLAASLYLYFKTADSVQHQQYGKIKKQTILLCNDLVVFISPFHCSWETESCVTPGDTALEVVRTWKAVAMSLLCSRADLLYFKWIHKTLSPKTLSSSRSLGFTPSDSPLPGLPGQADQRQRAPSLPHRSSLGKGIPWCHWNSGTLLCTTLAGCDMWHWQQQWFSWQPHQTPLPPLLCWFLQLWWCCCGAATCHFWGNGAVTGPTHLSIHLLQFQLSERKSGLIFQNPLTVNGMRETSPESSSPCHEEPAKAVLEEWPFGSVQLPQMEPCCSLALGSPLPNYYSKPFPEHQYWCSGKGLES